MTIPLKFRILDQSNDLTQGAEITLTYPDLSNAARKSSSALLRENPYPGLRPFQVEDASYFCGRSEAIAMLREKVDRESFIALVGNSGTGKSSLLRAGLIHALQNEEGEEKPAVRILQPGEKPLDNLISVLVDPQLSASERSQQISQIQPLIYQGAEGFSKIIERFFPHSLILLIDQFEEIFTLCKNIAERQTFLNCLLGESLSLTEKNRVSGQGNKACIVIAFRTDFLSQCLGLDNPILNHYLQNNLFILPNLDRDGLKAAIAEPAKKADFPLKIEFINTLIEDTIKCSHALPLLQYTLFQLWRERNDHGIQLSDYRSLGGIENCLDQRANLTYQNLTEFEQETAQHILLSLIPPQQGNEGISVSLINQDLVTPSYSLAAINLVVKKMAHEQLLATEPIPHGQGIDPPVTLHLAHECIVQEWRLLQQWLRQRDRSLNQKQQLEETAMLWQNSSIKEQKQHLLTGQSLNKAKKIQDDERQGKSRFDETPLSQVAEVFIQASIRSQQSDRLKLTALIAIVPVILIIILGFYLYRQSQFQGYWNVVRENQDKRESQPRIKALETLNQMGASLDNQNFNQINLQNINLSKANLSDSNFVESFLTGANLTGANLSKANLTQAELTGANLTAANLTQGQLTNSYLTGANLSKANLTQANLSQANLMRSNFNQANLEAANLNKAELTGANLTQANLQKSRFQKANLWGVDLSNANLENTDFSQADLTRVNFAGVKLKGIKLKNANLTNADLSAVNVLPLAEIKTACFWETAIFPEEIKQQLTHLKTTYFPSCPAVKRSSQNGGVK